MYKYILAAFFFIFARADFDFIMQLKGKDEMQDSEDSLRPTRLQTHLSRKYAKIGVSLTF